MSEKLIDCRDEGREATAITGGHAHKIMHKISCLLFRDSFCVPPNRVIYESSLSAPFSLVVKFCASHLDSNELGVFVSTCSKSGTFIQL